MKLTLIAGAVFAFCGCAHQKVATFSYAENVYCPIAGGEFERNLGDPLLDRSVEVVDISLSKTNDGARKANARVRNATLSPVRVRYRFDWYDTHGGRVVDPGRVDWEKLTIAPGGCESLSSVAPKEADGECRLNIKKIAQQGDPKEEG